LVIRKSASTSFSETPSSVSVAAAARPVRVLAGRAVKERRTALVVEDLREHPPVGGQRTRQRDDLPVGGTKEFPGLVAAEHLLGERGDR
jgi:hypothetical protein